MYKGPLELAPDRAQSLQPRPHKTMAGPAARSPTKLMALQLLLWHSAFWTGQEAVPLDPASSLPVPQSFVLKCLEQVRKIQAQGSVLQEKLCATYQLCHPEELALLGHSLGIPQAPLSNCSSQGLQLVSGWRGMGRGGSEGGTTPLCQDAWEQGVAHPMQRLPLLLCPLDRLPEPTAERPLPLPGPPAGPGRDIPRVVSHCGHATAGCCQLCHHCLAADGRPRGGPCRAAHPGHHANLHLCLPAPGSRCPGCFSTAEAPGAGVPSSAPPC
ncbi:granulocyte colony-stimulating factor isoform X1 [Ictidomys tridecemlineatus]